FFFSSRRRHTRSKRDWSSDVCSSDLTFHGGGIVTTVEHDDRAIRVDCVGPAGYASDMPWLAPREDLIEVDPLVIVRKVWNHLQRSEERRVGKVGSTGWGMADEENRK